MDVGMSIASTIQEIYEQDKTLSMKRLLYQESMLQYMMGTMTNTLIFAYVGGAMTTLVINYAYDLSYRQEELLCDRNSRSCKDYLEVLVLY